MLQELFIFDDLKFNDKFKIFANNQEITRLILTPELRNFLTEINEQHNIYLLFIENKMIFADNTRLKMLDLDFRKPISHNTIEKFYKNFTKYYNILQNIVDLVNVEIQETEFVE
jgi:hypothetical protein